LIHFL
jgi:hypothetical protein